VNRLTLFPMDYEEFLIAMGKSDFVARIKDCCANGIKTIPLYATFCI